MDLDDMFGAFDPNAKAQPATDSNSRSANASAGKDGSRKRKREDNLKDVQQSAGVKRDSKRSRRDKDEESKDGAAAAKSEDEEDVVDLNLDEASDDDFMERENDDELAAEGARILTEIQA